MHRDGSKSGGRQKGSLNRATAEVMAVAQRYTAEAVGVLATIMQDETAPAAARVSAANALLDRGHGKASQHVTAKSEITMKRYDEAGPLADFVAEALGKEQPGTA